MMSKSKLRTVLATALLAAAPALAHVNLEKPEAARGKSYKAVLKVPHGCEGSPTHTVRVEIPEGFIGVKPMPKPGWALKTERGPYAREYGYYHGPLKEGVRRIEWSGGSLPDEHYDEFVASGFVARESTDAQFYFKVSQICDKGELHWVEIPAKGVSPHDLAAPAAMLKIVDGGSADAHDHHKHGHGATQKAGSGTIGAVKIEGGWTRATADGAKVGAGYLKLTNTGGAAETLIAVETAVAGTSEIHDMTMSDEGVMRMRRLADGLEIPAGGSAELKPGGMHLMFLDLKQPLKEGATLTVTLRFKSGAEGEITFPVKPIGGSNTGHHDHGSHHGHH